jgi:hypothetical protein
MQAFQGAVLNLNQMALEKVIFLYLIFSGPG